MKNKINIFDKALIFINPKAAYERASWTQSAKMRYDAGSSTGRNSNWNAVNSPAEQINQMSRDKIRARARDLEINSDIAEAIIGNFERNVVGTGIKLQAKILKKDGITEDTELNKKVESLWKEWCRARNCDITGQQTFHEMLAMSVRRKKVDGGILFIKVYTNNKIPFTLQAREVDDIYTSLNTITVNGNRILHGIEIDKYNKPIAYWLKNVTPDGMWISQPERITADRVIYLFNKKRPSQVREMSELARTAGRIRDINETVEAVSLKEFIQACFSIFIKKQLPGGSGRPSNPLEGNKASGYKETKLTPGMITELQPGDDVITANPSGASSSLKDFVTTQQRLAGSGQGLSYEAASRDMSQVNYSSARQGLLQDQITYGVEQLYLQEHFCYEVYTEFLISAYLSGQIDLPDFWKDKDRYLQHAWVNPGWSWIDPLKEVKAYETALDLGLTTRSEICASQGKDWKTEIAPQLRIEQDIIEKEKLNLNNKTGGNINAADMQNLITGD